MLTHADRRELRLYDKHLKQEAKIEIKAHGEFLDQKIQEERERRAKEPKADLGTFEEFLEYVALRERLERERIERGDAEIDYSQLPWRPQPQTYEDLSPEQKRYENFSTVRELHSDMAKEANEAGFDLIAQSIKKRVWKDKPIISPAVTIQREGDLKIGIKEDGSILNRSRFGVAISYDHDNRGVYTLQEEKLSFGIGYFGDRAQIIPEARELFSDEELQSGVKAYFVQRSYTAEEHGKLVRKTELVAIPLAYEDSQHTFIEHLYNSAKSLAPETVLPQSKKRAKAYRRTGYYAAAA